MVWQYYAYSISKSYGFYLPVGIVYLTHVRGYGLGVVGLTQAAFTIGMMAAEIPTGYVGDRIGRRASLAVGKALSAVALTAYVFVQSPLGYVVLNLVWAVGWAFRSGTEDAWLYDLLASHGEAAGFTRISSRANTLLLVTSAGTAIAAGVLVNVSWALPFFANAALTSLGIPILLTLPAVSDDTTDGRTFTLDDAIKTLRLQATRPEIRWLVVYAALFYGLYEMTRSFEQPAAVAVGVPVTGLGVLYAGFKLVSAGAASSAGWLEEHFGTRWVFALLAPVVGLMYASIVITPLLVVPVLFLNRSIHVVVRPIRNQYLNDRLDNVGRATILSGVSMVLTLSAGAANLVGGWIATTTGPVQFLTGAGVVVAGAGGLLWMRVSPVRAVSETTTEHTEEPAAPE